MIRKFSLCLKSSKFILPATFPSQKMALSTFLWYWLFFCWWQFFLFIYYFQCIIMHFPLLKYLNAFSLIVGVFLLHCVVIKKMQSQRRFFFDSRRWLAWEFERGAWGRRDFIVISMRVHKNRTHRITIKTELDDKMFVFQKLT